MRPVAEAVDQPVVVVVVAELDESQAESLVFAMATSQMPNCRTSLVRSWLVHVAEVGLGHGVALPNSLPVPHHCLDGVPSHT